MDGLGELRWPQLVMLLASSALLTYFWGFLHPQVTLGSVDGVVKR